MIVLSEGLLKDGVPQRDPLAIPRTLVHNSSMHFTFNKFWRRYGKFAKHLMKVGPGAAQIAVAMRCYCVFRCVTAALCPVWFLQVKLKKYTKFIFVRDPFVRLISAYRNKFELPNDEFYRHFAQVMLRRYANQPTPPASVDEAFEAGIRPSFSHFIQYLLDPKTEQEVAFNEHWRQVYRLCHPCQIQYDFVGHLETAEEDAQHLLRLLRVDNVVEFPTSSRNLTASSWVADWFSTVPVEARRKLYKLYEPDFRLFGYHRPDSVLEG